MQQGRDIQNRPAEGFATQGKATVGRHPIHPMLIPFPIAFFVGSIVCDIIYGSSDNPFWYTMSTWLIAFGIIGGLLAATAGFVDYFTAKMSDAGKRNATMHMVANLTVVVLYVINYFLRVNNPPGLTAGYVLSIVALAILVYSGWLGGELVYVDRVGVTPARAGAASEAEEPPARQRPAA